MAIGSDRFEKLFVEMNISNGKLYRSFRSNWIVVIVTFKRRARWHPTFIALLISSSFNFSYFHCDAYEQLWMLSNFGAMHSLIRYDRARWNQFSLVSSFMAFVILIFLSASMFDSAIDIARQTYKTAVNFCFPSHGRWKSNVCHIVTELNAIAVTEMHIYIYEFDTLKAIYHNKRLFSSSFPSHSCILPQTFSAKVTRDWHRCVRSVFEFRDMGAFFAHTLIWYSLIFGTADACVCAVKNVDVGGFAHLAWNTNTCQINQRSAKCTQDKQV